MDSNDLELTNNIKDTSGQFLHNNIIHVPLDITLGNNVNNLTITADIVSVSIDKMENKIISGNISDSNPETNLQNSTLSENTLGGNEVFFTTIKDIIFDLILNIKPLRSKLNQLLDVPAKAITDISNIFKEVSNKLKASDMDKLRKFFLIDNVKSSLSSILLESFNNIMADGKIDINDTKHFLNLIYNIINLFNSYTQQLEVSLSIDSETINIFLYFIIKCTLILTLDDNEELAALELLDTTFKLVSISILPIISNKYNCAFFSCFNKK
jgi:hypothetical protein